MNILLVYPKYPTTFWSLRYLLRFISKRAVHPPLGLLTVAAMLPKEWNKKLVDMNVEELEDRQLEWADYVFISAMDIQRKSVESIIKRCKNKKKKIVAGGPLFTTSYQDLGDIDYFVLNEAEVTLPRFIEDLKNNCAKRIYSSNEFADIRKTPVPLWELVNMRRYASMSIQYSRGCPFDCEFCDITTLFGRSVRTKTKEQILLELEKLYNLGWKGNVFFVDDNFIGNKNRIKKEILPAIISWMRKRRYPFMFSTEASINLADDEELIRMMVEAGFNSVFVGIETPNEESLVECNKYQNKNRDLVESVKKIQSFGLEVIGGFIVGFDNDPPSIFQRQIDFIQKSKIIIAMVGLLNAPRGTRLYYRLRKEDRLLGDISGDNTDFSLNFVPKMGHEKLMEGYKRLLKGIYSIKPYYTRVMEFLRNVKLVNKSRYRLSLSYIAAFFRSIFVLGIKEKGRFYYWKLFFWSLFRCPRKFPLAISYALYGYHFRRIFGGIF